MIIVERLNLAHVSKGVGGVDEQNCDVLMKISKVLAIQDQYI